MNDEHTDHVSYLFFLYPDQCQGFVKLDLVFPRVTH